MSDIQTGTTWADGEEVNSARLNNMLNDAVIEPEFYSTKPTATPIASDSQLFYQASTDSLKLSSITNIVRIGAFGLIQPNFVLVGPASGSPAIPTFRRVTPLDIVPPLIALSDFNTVIDWSQGNVFTQTLGGNITFTFAHATGAERNGQTIHVILTQGPTTGHTIAWPSCHFRVGDVINMTDSLAVNSSAVFQFTVAGPFIYGAVLATNMFPRTS